MTEVLNGKTINKVGTEIWYKNGKLHREDGPSIIYIDGTKEWYQNGKRHREDGPAFVLSGGYKSWYKDGLRHREDGPAIEFTNGDKEWWFQGERLSETMEKVMAERKVAKSTTKKQVNESAVQNAVTVAMKDQPSKFDFSNIAKLNLDLQDVLKENKQPNLCLALVKEAPQEYFMTVAAHNQAITLDDVAAEHGLYMFCLERVDSGKGLESEFRVGFKVQSENTTPVESMKKFIACFKEVK
jgi:hypothetical protein